MVVGNFSKAILSTETDFLDIDFTKLDFPALYGPVTRILGIYIFTPPGCSTKKENHVL